jgi:ComF family protein
MAVADDPQVSVRRGLGGRIGAVVLEAACGIADLVVPPVCLVCRRPLGSHDSLCGGGWRAISFIRPPLCDRMGIPLPYDTGGPTVSGAALRDPPIYDRARAVARFDRVMRELIHKLKYGDRHDARRLFGRWLEQAGAEILVDCDLIVPVPLHRWRLLSRRFNQAAILAQELSRETGIPCDPLSLVRVRWTSSQVGLRAAERQRNLAGAFAVTARGRRRVRGRNLVLIDDVITTGATVSACARMLKRAGARRVDVLALALATDDSRIFP